MFHLEIMKGILFPNSLNMQVLTNLYLHSVTFCGRAKPFSSCCRL